MVSVYCSGSIIKGKADNGKLCWTSSERSKLVNGANRIHIEFLSPDDPIEGLNESNLVFGRDLCQIKIADVIVVDARERRGIGIGVEMMAARIYGTPLIIVAPKNSYYRMDTLEYRGSRVNNYIHPHLEILADSIVDSFEEAGRQIKSWQDTKLKPKSLETLNHSIHEYETKLLPNDKPMAKFLSAIKESTNNSNLIL